MPPEASKQSLLETCLNERTGDVLAHKPEHRAVEGEVLLAAGACGEVVLNFDTLLRA